MDNDTLARQYTGPRAQRYDEERVGSEKWNLEQTVVESMLGRLSRGATVLDVPVGTGRFIEFYKRFQLRVTGVDASLDMLAEADRKAKALDFQLAVVHGTIFDLAFDGDSFDAVVCVRFLNWLDEPDFAAAVGELARVTCEHLILGVRHVVPLMEMALHTPAGWVRFGRQCITRLRGKRLSSITLHRRELVQSVFERFHLEVAEACRVEARYDGTDYFIYLLRRRSAHVESELVRSP